MDASSHPEHKTAETLLIVDDEPHMTDIFRQFMSKRGFQVLTAGSGREALALPEVGAGVVSLVITDMTMPEMTGIELAQAFGAILPDIPVLIATGHDIRLEELSAVPNIAGVIRKPYQNRTLAERIREILDAQVSS